MVCQVHAIWKAIRSLSQIRSHIISCSKHEIIKINKCERWVTEYRVVCHTLGLRVCIELCIMIHGHNQIPNFAQTNYILLAYDFIKIQLFFFMKATIVAICHNSDCWFLFSTVVKGVSYTFLTVRSATGVKVGQDRFSTLTVSLHCSVSVLDR